MIILYSKKYRYLTNSRTRSLLYKFSDMIDTFYFISLVFFCIFKDFLEQSCKLSLFNATYKREINYTNIQY